MEGGGEGKNIEDIRVSSGETMFDPLMVLPLGLLYSLTWEMVRNQSVGGGKCVSWFLFCVATQRRPQRPKAAELPKETEIGAC